MEIATKGQLRWGFLRWAAVTVPLIILLGFASSQIAPMGADSAWYQALRKPSANPPDWAFPVAWTALYILLGVALAMILNARGARLRGLAILLFAAQMLLNLAWTPLFFGAHQVAWALAVLIAMVLFALLTTLVFGRIRTAAAWLMVPYLAWLCFAGGLNWSILRLNPNAATLVAPSANAQIAI